MIPGLVFFLVEQDADPAKSRITTELLLSQLFSFQLL